MIKMQLTNGDGPYVFHCGDSEPIKANVEIFTGLNENGKSQFALLLSEASENEGPALSIRVSEVARQVCERLEIDSPADPRILVLEYEPASGEKREVFRHHGLEYRSDNSIWSNGIRTRELSREQAGRIIGDENLPELTMAQENNHKIDLPKEYFNGEAKLSQQEIQEIKNNIGIDI